MKDTDLLQKSFESLQKRFDGGIVIVDDPGSINALNPNSVQSETQNSPDGSGLNKEEINRGFVDISAKPSDLWPLYGRVVLTLNRTKRVFSPAVITNRTGATQITIMDTPFSETEGITDGILFGLGLKNKTASTSFGAHGYGKLEAGHLTPALLGVRDNEAREQLVQRGDKGSHKILDDKSGGVPEKLISAGLIDNNSIPIKTKEIPADVVVPIPIYWHKKLETNEGLMIAEYPNSLRLMLGSAADALGDKAVDQVGELVTHASRGANI